jgi:hypothetical protein
MRAKGIEAGRGRCAERRIQVERAGRGNSGVKGSGRVTWVADPTLPKIGYILVCGRLIGLNV